MSRRHLGAALGSAVSVTALFLASLALPLQTAANLGLDADRAASWILVSYGLPGLLAIVLSWRYRMPLLLTGNIFVFILIARISATGEETWPQIIAATIVAGVALLILGPVGIIERLRRILPAPIVFGLLAGAVLPFFIDMFTSAGDAPAIVLPAVATWALARRFLEPRVPAILPALAVAVVAASATGRLDAAGISWVVARPVLTAPEIDLAAIVSLAPVILVLMTVQANVPATIFLREQRYEPPDRALTGVCASATTLASALGPSAVSLSLVTTAITAGPDAGPASGRWRAGVVGGVGELAIGLGAAVVVVVAPAIPAALLATAVGLAVVGILSTSLERISAGPMRWGPLVALGVAMSDLTLLGLGAFFWAIVGGIATSLLLEPQGLRAARA